MVGGTVGDTVVGTVEDIEDKIVIVLDIYIDLDLAYKATTYLCFDLYNFNYCQMMNILHRQSLDFIF